MDTKKITAIVDLMKASDLLEFEIEEEGLKLRICRGKAKECTHDLIYTQLAPAIGSSAINVPFPMQAASGAPERVKDYEYIKSPMIGTFYRSPSPDSKVYASEGTQVNKDSVVCIIEAMKVMNEIQAETNGSILEVLVEDGSSVEYGQNLFKVKQP